MQRDKEKKNPRPLEKGDYVVMLVPPFIKGVIINTYKGKYVDEVTLQHRIEGLVVVGTKHVKKIKVVNPNKLVYGNNSELKENAA